MNKLICAALAALALAIPSIAHAKVAAQSATGFALTFEADVKGTPQTAYDAFLDVADWWSPDHTYSRDSKNLSIEPKNGGCWCEALPNGGFVRRMDVLHVVPGRRLLMRGGLGPLAFMGVHGAMSVNFERNGDRTRVTLRYALGGYDESDFKELPKRVDGVLADQFARYAAVANGGKL